MHAKFVAQLIFRQPRGRDDFSECNFVMKILLSFLFLLSGSLAFSQSIVISGEVVDSANNTSLPFVNVILRDQSDSTFITGCITDEDGIFRISNLQSGNYLLEISFTGYKTTLTPTVVGTLSPFLDFGKFYLTKSSGTLGEVVISEKHDEVGGALDKKTFAVADNVSQSGGSLIDMLKTLPGVTVSQDGKILLRGNDKVLILIDGKQTALVGTGDITALENIPASAVDRIEIINNPSSKYDANGNAGIINIILKKEEQDGFNGKIGMSGGVGSLWEKKENLPGIRPQYKSTPKFNPTASLNYRKNKTNIFLQTDYLYTQTLNKNEFVTRTYDNSDTIQQQTKRNRNTGFFTVKTGVDYYLSERSLFSISAFFSHERIIDRGDEPFYDADLTERLRLWQFLEDEVKITATASTAFQYKFKQPGHLLNLGLNYMLHRENEKYFFTNVMPTYVGYDSFKLLSDEHVVDFNADYKRPLKYGYFETGVRVRQRYIPTNMQFYPGLNSPLDTNAGGWANYSEIIPAVYGNYVVESKMVDIEAGLRLEYVNLNYKVNPEHSTYHTSGYDYAQPFPNVRMTFKITDHNRISLFYNRRVDRPNEVDIRIFPKYDDAEIVKVGNPGLRPQFTNSFEASYKTSWKNGYLYASLFHKIMSATITRISSIVPNSTVIYAIFQNAGKGTISGGEIMIAQNIRKWATCNISISTYQNVIHAFTVQNQYPEPSTFSEGRQQIVSGNAKIALQFHLKKKWEMQCIAIYLAPDIIPQGRIDARFSADIGVKKTIQSGKGEFFANATDIANTLKVRRTIVGSGFAYVSTDYYETQVFRLGYSYRF